MYYLKEEYLYDDNINNPWVSMDNWITEKEWKLLDKTKQSYYVFVK